MLLYWYTCQMINLPQRTMTKPKICKHCEIPLNSGNSVKRNGYIVRSCKPCNKEIQKKHYEKKRQAMKQFKEHYG